MTTSNEAEANWSKKGEKTSERKIKASETAGSVGKNAGTATQRCSRHQEKETPTANRRAARWMSVSSSYSEPTSNSNHG